MCLRSRFSTMCPYVGNDKRCCEGCCFGHPSLKYALLNLKKNTISRANALSGICHRWNIMQIHRIICNLKHTKISSQALLETVFQLSFRIIRNQIFWTCAYKRPVGVLYSWRTVSTCFYFNAIYISVHTLQFVFASINVRISANVPSKTIEISTCRTRSRSLPKIVQHKFVVLYN